jgi:hypothetical protein
MNNSFDHPPGPVPFGKLRTCLARKGGEIKPGGYPQTPTKGVKPLWTPLFQQPTGHG